MRIYLCGPINGCTDAEAKDWRGMVQARYPAHEYVDPMRNDYRGREMEPGIAEEIVEADKKDIIDSDVILVNYDKPSVGTSMEVFFAREIGKFVIVVAQPSTVISPWLKFHSHAILPSFAEAMEKIGLIDSALQFQDRRVEEMQDSLDAVWNEVLPEGR